VITYDARGYGQSTLPDTTPYSFTEDLAALSDYLKIDKAVIVGHSMGGTPAFFYSLDYQDRVLALVLAEGGVHIPDTLIISPGNLRDLAFPCMGILKFIFILIGCLQSG
jgi:pimeloyl-ACP methyl ester carboxylesterase